MQGPVFVFNGDADGIFSQHMLQLSGIKPSALVTGVKRDIQLLRKLQQPPGRLFVLDISMARNQADLHRLLDAGSHVTWLDHHDAGEIPKSPRLETRIATSASTCTGILTHSWLGGKYRHWAAAAAYGDNIHTAAEGLLGGDSHLRAPLEKLGMLLNYNAYGEDEADLLYAPAELALILEPFSTPMDFIDKTEVVPKLEAQFLADEEACASLTAHAEVSQAACFLFPEAKWARRYGSTYVNRLSAENPAKAFAALMEAEDHFVVSIRSPRFGGPAAVGLASRYETGGGRQQAAGINQLPRSELDAFVSSFLKYYS